MTIFWIIAGLLTLGALLFVALPLLRGGAQSSVKRSELNMSIYRDQLRELNAELAAGTMSEEQFRSAKDELEKRVLEDSGTDDEAATAPLGGRRLIVAAVVAVPLLAALLYFTLGKQPEGVDPQRKPAGQAQQGVTQQQIEAMVAKLAQRLKENPEDAEGWVMLGRSYATLRRFGDSSAAYARAAALMPNNGQVLTDYADVLAMVNGRSMQGEPEKIIQQALKVDPNNVKALALAGTAAFQRRDYNHAIAWWQKVLALVPPDSPVARSINANISQAQGLSGQPLAGGQGAAEQGRGQTKSASPGAK